MIANESENGPPTLHKTILKLTISTSKLTISGPFVKSKEISGRTSNELTFKQFLKRNAFSRRPLKRRKKFCDIIKLERALFMGKCLKNFPLLFACKNEQIWKAEEKKWSLSAHASRTRHTAHARAHTHANVNGIRRNRIIVGARRRGERERNTKDVFRFFIG